MDIGGAGASEASLGATAAGRALAGSRSDSSRFGSGGPRSDGSQVSYQWHMAPWTSGGGISGSLSEVVPLVPMRATLLPVVAAGGPTRVSADPASNLSGGRVTRSGRYMSRSPPSSGAGGSARSPGGRGDVYSSPSSAGRGDGEERSPYDPWRFDPDNHRVYNVGPEGRSSHPIGYPMERGPCSVLDLVLSGSLRGLDVAELREVSHDRCEVFVFRAQPGGERQFVVD